MADPKTPGQFGTPQGADPSIEGKKGAKAQSKEYKVKGGKHSSPS